MRKIITLLLFLEATLTYGQFNSSILDYNNSSASITDAGIFFNDPVNGYGGYEVPKGGGINAIYAMALWFGAHDINGQLRLSGSGYQNNTDIFPGPICSDTTQYNSALYTSLYSPSIWSVSQSEVENHILNWNQGGYVIPNSIANWPGNGDASIGVADQLAPYVDMNGNNIYEPAQGDYPNIRGDVATYVIMNDGRDLHTNSGGERLYIEVHVMFYQYVTNDYLNDLTFMNVRVFNRGGYSYSDFKSSIYTDADIGNYSDDYVGCDSLRNMMFTYNGDANDEANGGTLGYGIDPPSIAIKSLNQQMTSSTYYTNAGASPVGDPSNAAAFWNYMNGLWADGSPMVFGGTGYPGSPGATNSVTNYMFSGDPIGLTTPITPWNWTEFDTDGAASANPANDRRMVMSMAETSLLPGDYVCYDYVVVYGPGTPGVFPSGISTLQQRADSVQSWYDNQIFDCQQVVLSINEIEEVGLMVYPNPSSGIFNVEFDESHASISTTVHDMTGRMIHTAKHTNTNQCKIDLSETSGVFILVIESPSGTTTKRLIVE